MKMKCRQWKISGPTQKFTPFPGGAAGFVEATQVVYEEYMDNGLLTMDDLARMKRIIRGEEK